ncbi:MAG TPA: hypothetical protein VJZ69_01115 [Clostridia bacterium]|nr:hypothetical protein [Clostridia bacterium]
MALDSMMLPLLMSMMGKGKDGDGAGGMDMEMMTKLISGMQNGNSPDLLSMLPQNEQTKGIMEIAKLMGAMGKGKVETQEAEKPPIEGKTAAFSSENPFQAVNGFCGNEVNSALNKLFNNK